MRITTRLGYAYGTTQRLTCSRTSPMQTTTACRLSWIKTDGHLTFNLNGTWSKMLGTTIQQDPYTERGNYGPTAEDRPLVFNSSYTYNSGTLHTGSTLLNRVGRRLDDHRHLDLAEGRLHSCHRLGELRFGLQYTGLPANAPSGCGDKGSPPASETRRTSERTRAFRSGPCLTCNPTSWPGYSPASERHLLRRSGMSGNTVSRWRLSVSLHE